MRIRINVSYYLILADKRKLFAFQPDIMIKKYYNVVFVDNLFVLLSVSNAF